MDYYYALNMLQTEYAPFEKVYAMLEVDDVLRDALELLLPDTATDKLKNMTIGEVIGQAKARHARLKP